MIQQALDFLRLHNEVALATCDGGKPRIRQFQIMKQEGAVLYFATSAQKAVYSQLKANPNVELLASADRVSVRCSGQASFAVDEATQRWIYEHNEVLRRLYSAYDKMVYFSVAIDEIDYYDLRPTPPVLLHHNLATNSVAGGFVGERFGICNPTA